MRLTPRSKAVPFCPRSDRSEESQWLMKLHTYGLLRNSFRLAETMEGVRTIWRLRDRHVKQAGRSVQHMQKALTKMNVQLANVISDISGVSGQAIIAAILKGERDPYKLVDLNSIDGIDVMTAQTILSELGTDLSAFPTENHFASWLGLRPSKDISGGKVIGRSRRTVQNRVATSLRMAASTLLNSKSYLGGRYRHLRKHLPPLKTVRAVSTGLELLQGKEI